MFRPYQRPLLAQEPQPSAPLEGRWEQSSHRCRRTKHLCGVWHHPPGLRKIEDETIERQTIVEQADTLVCVPTKRDEIRHRAHIPLNVQHRRLREILPSFVGYH